MMSALREYVKLRYMGDCKCGDCQLVPTKVLYEEDAKFDAIVKALEAMLVDPPATLDEPIARGALSRVENVRSPSDG
jgi:hypothetical protein